MVFREPESWEQAAVGQVPSQSIQSRTSHILSENPATPSIPYNLRCMTPPRNTVLRQNSPFLVPSDPHMSIASLNLSTPFPFNTPSTPSGIQYEREAGPPFSDNDASSDVFETRTSPATLIDSMSAGTIVYEVGQYVGLVSVIPRGLTRSLDEQTRPMKLLDWAIRTASFTDIELRPLISISAADGPDAFCFAPRSLHSSTGSVYVSLNAIIKAE
jgi:hypothetical protein